ncbi:MAG: dihydroxy-acid dehydratase [Chitinophagaceae bacterium]|nr:dihydroxy-acid dehydratase [Chitinophagaceae bacterium]MCA6454026.1 dihydroxy-acid dehydratase [Chitinophagaceae bacterium]MCA6455747.1 dihydroxy-acid dehydratase [Chitinophagaceae bacterium]MCA6460449.1 dihydroxy-acid dehydratase [Chitinophagaceae bacterium]MCA6465336.1 dihydroxy-acid dehydratase [Chitinophagaceae bacterium]
MNHKLRSNFEEGSTRWAVRRAQWIAMGIPEADFEKPKIAIINSSSGLSVCYQHLDEMSVLAQQAVKEAGGLAFEINTIAPSDFVTSAGKKARYLMPTRDLMVNDIEVMMEGAVLDGMILLSSCDKTTPAHIMAAARLNVPAIVVPCGYQLGGNCNGKVVDIEEVYKGVGTLLTGKMTLDDMKDWTRCAIQGPGVCAGLATANSMHCMAEAMGMALPQTTPVRAGSDRLKQIIRTAGAKIIELVEQDLRPRDILTKEAFQNAVRVAISIGCSVNTVRHLAAISVEAELDLDIVKMFEEESAGFSLITQIRPNGPDRIEDLDRAGGTNAVMHRLQSQLNTGVLTVQNTTLSAILSKETVIDETIIRKTTDPFRKEPGLVIIRGNVAPSGAIVKLSGIDGANRIFKGPARVYEEEDLAMQELAKGNIVKGDIVVLRMMGPVGGPGTVFACSFMAALSGAGLADTVAVVTDGELSGLNKGITIGQVMPEAACGGPLAIIEEGDSILIDLDNRKIDLQIPEAEYQNRMRNWQPKQRKLENNWLKFYADNVMPIEQGAVFGRRN